MIEKLYICFINTSVSSLILCFVVLIARWLLKSKKLPQIFVYCLWVFVLFRFLFLAPVSVPFGLSPTSQTKIPEYSSSEQLAPETDPLKTATATIKRVLKGNFDVQSVVASVDSNGSTLTVQDYYEWWEAFVYFGQYLWIAVCVILLAIGLSRYFRLRKNLSGSRCVWNGIYLSDKIQAPVVFGILEPKIYIPSVLGKRDRLLTILHGKCHVGRRDPLWKALAFLMLCVYWFNPLVWVVYWLLHKDMEASCDESVLEMLGEEERPEYIRLLGSFDLDKRRNFPGLSTSIVEYGGSKRATCSVECRKDLHWMLRVAVAIFCIVVGCFAFDHKSGNYGFAVEQIFDSSNKSLPVSIEFEMEEYPGVTFLYTHKAGDLFEIEGNRRKAIIEGRFHKLFLADLNGDGCREFCATQTETYLGYKVVVFDYVDKMKYELMNPRYMYNLVADMGGMVTNKVSSLTGFVEAQGKLTIRNRTLLFSSGLNFAIGVRTTPVVDRNMMASYFNGEGIPDNSHNQLDQDGNVTTGYNAAVGAFIKYKQAELYRGLSYTQNTVTIPKEKQEQYVECCRYLLLLGELAWSAYQDYIYYNPEKPEQLFVCTEYRDRGCKDIKTYYEGVVSGAIEAHPETYLIRLDEYGIYRWGSEENLYPGLVG